MYQNTKIVILFSSLVFLKLAETKFEVCDNRFDIVSSLTQAKCPVLDDNDEYKYYLFKEGIHECLPYCQKIKKGLTKDQFCSDNGSPCPPGYECQGSDVEANCVLMPNSCFKYHVNYADVDNPFYNAMWKPSCLDDGTWAPKQCKGEASTGRCYCFDAIGNRLHGHQFASKAENMTCSCSRKRAEMQESNPNVFVSLHCDDEGNYEPLQCNQGECWCVETKTGMVVSKIVPEKLMTKLACYDKKTIGEQYLRQCESHLFAQNELVNELKIHGTVGFNFDHIICGADGNYAGYRIELSSAYCVWKDNSFLGAFQIDLTGQEKVENMNCNCALDTKIYQMAGLNPKLQCQNNGNYKVVHFKSLENGAKKYFCVDLDGFQKSELFDDEPKDCSIYK